MSFFRPKGVQIGGKVSSESITWSLVVGSNSQIPERKGPSRWTGVSFSDGVRLVPNFSIKVPYSLEERMEFTFHNKDSPLIVWGGGFKTKEPFLGSSKRRTDRREVGSGYDPLSGPGCV